jgi:hypothetical protein
MCIKSLKLKNSGGYDHIPQRIVIDAVDILGDSLTKLIKHIYEQRQIS